MVEVLGVNLVALSSFSSSDNLLELLFDKCCVLGRIWK